MFFPDGLKKLQNNIYNICTRLSPEPARSSRECAKQWKNR